MVRPIPVEINTYRVDPSGFYQDTVNWWYRVGWFPPGPGPLVVPGCPFPPGLGPVNWWCVAGFFPDVLENSETESLSRCLDEVHAVHAIHVRDGKVKGSGVLDLRMVV